MKRIVYIRLIVGFSAILWFGALPAWGQYSSADCAGPQVLGTDSLQSGTRTCTDGILFTANVIPHGTWHTFFVETRPTGAPNNPHFHFTRPGLSLHGFMNTEDELRLFNPEPDDRIFVYATTGLGDGFACDPNETSLPIRGCPTNYGMFFDIDSDGDGQFDDMEVVFIDGLAVPLNFRILFVPLNWVGTQATFDNEAQNHINLFANSTALGGCLNTIEFETLDVNTQNFNTFNCAAGCNHASIRAFVRDLGLYASQYDVVVGLGNAGGLCAPGCSNGMDTVWVQVDTTPVLAHEIGHCYNLADEYCSEESGGDQRCAGPGDINFLGADLGCNPNTGMGCCFCPNGTSTSNGCSQPCDLANRDNYFFCCEGNDGTAGGGSKCIMGANGVGVGLQNWCQRCENWLNARAEFGCDALPTTPFRDLLAVDVTIPEDGEVQLNAVELVNGRPTRIDPAGNRFQILLDAPSGNLLNETFDGFHYNGGLPQTEYDVHYRVAVDFPIATPPPVVLTLLDNGQERFRGTLFGTAPVADAGEDIEAECTSTSGAEVTLDGTASYDTDGDMLRFDWSASGVVFDDPSSDTSSGQFPFGETDVILVVTDGVFESTDTVVVRVVDTTAPVITLNGPSEMTLECHVGSYSELGASVADLCDDQLTEATVGGDTVDVDTPGTYLVLYDAVDASGNPAEQVSRLVTVVDTIPPVINCPADTTVECDESTDPANTGDATATDFCDPNPMITFSDAITPGACPAEKTITRTWTTTDNSGRTSSCVQTINVVDTTPPLIDCKAPATITPPDAPISFTATATDNCDAAPSVEITGYDCFNYTQKGKRIDKTESCVVNVSGDTITILDSGGVGDSITWIVRSSDSCGNVEEKECKLEVINPSGQ